jgi:serine/threonine-protein kinase
MLARPAAVKLIREGVEGGGQTSDAARQRFAREAQTTANLGSPHTVQLYDYGVADDGTFYYVMEHLNGIDLETLVKDFGPISPARTIHLLKQMCHSLDEAHKNGLIHRDIKPANVIICRLGLEVDFVKVVDFGLVATKENTDSQITQAGAVPGTPAYMAPEMAQAVQVDNRSDLYAVGCVAYWLLTGTQVFTAPTAMAVILKHVSDEPEPLSKRAKRIIPADLEAVVMACLAKKPAERPQSARDLSERLATCELSETWTDDEAQQWWREHMGKEMTLST